MNLRVEGRNEFAVDSIQGEEGTGLDQEGEVAIIKEVLVFRTVLDTGQGRRNFKSK